MPAPLLETNDIRHLRTQFEAWMEGARARASESHRLNQNPYIERSACGDAWEHGWEVIDLEIRDRIKNMKY